MQPVDTIADIVHQYDGLVLVDAVQAFGKIPMVFNADYIAISAHKIGGPQGVGALYACPNTPFSPLLCGGRSRAKNAFRDYEFSRYSWFWSCCF